jgi:UrcA family protein
MISSRVLASVIGAYAVVCVLVAPRVTYADAIVQPPSAAVRFTDLNLDSRADVATLLHRIQNAAAEVCKPYASPGTLLPSAAHQSCIRDAVSGAVRKVDSPLLTAYYRQGDNRHSLNTASR